MNEIQASDLFPGFAALGFSAFSPADPPPSAGIAGGTVDARGFGWLSDGLGTRFPVTRGIGFLSRAGQTSAPTLLDAANFRHHDDILAELFANPPDERYHGDVWARTLQSIGLADNLSRRLAADALVICVGGYAWHGELIAGLVPEARIVTVLDAMDVGDIAYVDYWLPFGRRQANHDIAVVDDVGELGLAVGKASAVCLFETGTDTQSWQSLCAESGVLCAAGGETSNAEAFEHWVLEEMLGTDLPKSERVDPGRARLLISPVKAIDLNRARVTEPGYSEQTLSTPEVEALYFGARGWSLTEIARLTSRSAEEIIRAADRLSDTEVCAVTTTSAALARYHRYLCTGERHSPPETSTLPLVWRRAVERLPDTPAIELYDGTELSYRQMDNLVRRARMAMAKMGLSKGDRVGIWSGPCLEASVLFWAATAQGCVWVLLDPFAPAGAVAKRAKELALKHIYVERKLGDGASFEQPITPFDPTTEADETGSAEPKAPLLAKVKPNEAEESANPIIGPFDPATIAMTSGTTSGAKSMQLTHLAVIRRVNVEAQDRMSSRPGHVRSYSLRGGVTNDSLVRQTIACVFLGAMHILAFRPGAASFFETWSRIDQTRATYFAGSQAFMRQLGMALDLNGFVRPTHLEFIHCGGPLPAALRAKIAGYSTWQVGYGYSITETGNICGTQRHDATMFGGNMMGATNHAIVQIRSESGEVQVDGAGEIWIANDRAYDGYIKASGLDRSAKVGIWHRTGDVGRFDTEGNLYVLGRADEMINLESGRKVSPTVIEEMLQEDDRVMSSAILPCRDRYGGIQLFAFIAAPGIDDEEELREALVNLVRAEAGKEFLPYRWSFVDQIPATPRGKVDRRALAAQIPEDLKP